jgi:hypothetical protein
VFNQKSRQADTDGCSILHGCCCHGTICKPTGDRCSVRFLTIFNRRAQEQDYFWGMLGLALAKPLQYLHQTPKEDSTGFDFKIDRSRLNPNAHKLIAVVKSNHGFFPKNELEAKMKSWPSGSYLIMEMICPGSGVLLYAISYKYNAWKVLCFIMTANAGSTMPTKELSYITKFPDKHHNVCQQRVEQPEVLGIFFGSSNIIDVINQLQQDVLRLEKQWPTKDPWKHGQFTIIGISVIDCLW